VRSGAQEGRVLLRWFPRLALVAIVIGLAIPVAAARATTTVETIPFEITLTACGETISLSGTSLVVFIVQELSDGGFVVTTHENPQGVTGLSSSGITYHGTGVRRHTSVFIPSGVFTTTFVSRFHIVGTMGAPTFYVKATSHVTVTPSGDLTALVDNEVLRACFTKP
jgi:hypothetical protein